MVGQDKIYEYYVTTFSDKIDTLRKRITRVTTTRETAKNFLKFNSKWIALNTNTTYEEIIEGRDVRTIRCNDLCTSGELKITVSSFKKYIKLYNRAIELLEVLNTTKNESIIPRSLFIKINSLLDRHIVKYILNGYTLVLGKNHGEIRIREKTRLLKDTEKYNSKVPDWGASEKVKLAIAKEVIPEIHDKYVNREIRKKEFQKHIKPYLYSKTNPAGREWIVYYTSTYSYWWYWRKCKAVFANIHLYAFVPTFYNNTVIDGKSIKPTELPNHLTLDTMFDYPMGNIQKLALILKLDPNRHLMYRHDI